MGVDVVYSARERFWLWTLAAFGLVVVNGMFLYAIATQPESLADAVSNPLSAAFMLETLLLLGVLSYLLERWRVIHVGRAWFVVLALLGSLAFAIPVALLWNGHRPRRDPRD